MNKKPKQDYLHRFDMVTIYFAFMLFSVLALIIGMQVAEFFISL